MFVDVTMNAVWILPNSDKEKVASRDDGQTYRTEHMRQLWGAFFFLSDDIMIHSKSDYSLFSLIGDMGGYFEILYGLFVLLTFKYNDITFVNKAMRAVYMKSECHNNC